VNVFLGLGLPWLMGAIFWGGIDDTKKTEWALRYKDKPGIAADYPDGAFVVIAGDLGFSVIIFTLCACTTFAVFVFRRKACGGELGGAKNSRNGSAAFLVMLWFIYVAMSSWKTMDTLSKEKK